MTDELIVKQIDYLTNQILLYRSCLTNMYKQRRLLRKQLEQNHRIKNEI